MFKMPWTGKRKFSALEIEDGYVKFAQAEHSGRTGKIVKLIIKGLVSSSQGDIVGVLKSVVDEVKEPLGHLSVCIPRHKVTVRFLRFPTLNEKEIAGMVKLQSSKELPYAKEEIISDYLIIERTKDGYTTVALIIVHRDVINSYLNILKEANLEPERITFSTEAVLSWYEQAFGREKSKACSVLVDLDINNIDILIFYNSYLGFTRGLAWGARQLQEQPDLKDRLVEEIRRTIKGYSLQEGAKNIERIVLSQASDTTGELKAFLQQQFGLPCEQLSPLKNLNYEKKVSLVEYKAGLSLLRVLGMVLDSRVKKLNLLVTALREKQQLKLKRKKVLEVSILLLLIVLAGVLIVFKEFQDKRLYLFYLDREIKKTAPLAKEVENMFRKVELIEHRRKIEGSSIDVLGQLHSLVPRDIALSSFDFDEENKKLTLQGVSANMSEIFKFINTLEKSDYFQNVQLKYVSEKKARVSGFTDFKIECTLEK